jgi:hypothetical protein
MLAKHVNTCHTSALYVSYDQICFKILRGTWFEVFGLKIPFLQVLNCHNSPWRAITRNGEQNGRPGGLLATNSQWRVVQLAMASKDSSQWRASGSFWCRLLVLADLMIFVPDLLCSLL